MIFFKSTKNGQYSSDCVSTQNVSNIKRSVCNQFYWNKTFYLAFISSKLTLITYTLSVWKFRCTVHEEGKIGVKKNYKKLLIILILMTDMCYDDKN